MGKILGLIIGVIGVIIFVIMGYIYIITVKKLRADGINAEGKITDVRRKGSYKNRTFTCDVEFTMANGEQNKSTIDVVLKKPEIGTDVSITYDKDNPKMILLSDEVIKPKYITKVVVPFAGAVLLVVVLLILLLTNLT